MTTLRDLLLFGLVYLFLLPVRILPYRASLACGRRMARLFYPIAKRHRGVADENLADMAKARMIFIAALYQDDGRFHIKMRDLGTVDREAFPDREEAVRHYTERWVGTLEDLVREFPEQYFWVHQRWKTRPEDALPSSDVKDA